MLPSNNAQDLTQTLFRTKTISVGNKKKTYLTVITDTHGGHILGLMCPDVMCYNEDRDGNLLPYLPTLNVAQEELFAVYTRLIEKVNSLAGDGEVVLLHLGDITQGTFRPKELVSTRLADHISIAVNSIGHFVDTVSLDRLRAVRIVKGTGSHVFGEGSSESLVSMFLKAKYPSLDVRELYHGLADVGGVTVDYSHHGPVTGSREWIRGDDARRYLRDRMLKDILADREPPKLYLRGHVHDYIRETVRLNGFEADIVICPSLTFLDDYARKATRSIHKLTVGGMIFEIQDNKITDFIPVKETLDLRTKETI
jgi:hypothetical protein